MAKTVTTGGLRRINIIAGFLHLVQMIIVLALSNDFTLPINATYMSGPPGTTFAPRGAFQYASWSNGRGFSWSFRTCAFHRGQPTILWSLQQGLSRATKLFPLGGVLHQLFSHDRAHRSSDRRCGYHGTNLHLWRQRCDDSFGWLQEKYENPGNGGWLPFIFGCIAGAVPWLALVLRFRYWWSWRNISASICLWRRILNFPLLQFIRTCAVAAV